MNHQLVRHVREPVLVISAGFLFGSIVSCEAPGGTPRAAEGTVTIRDSAGVAIVENAGPPSLDLPAMRVDSVPVVSIGSGEGAEPEQFSWVPGASRLRDGTIVVLEASVPELRYFGPHGEFLARAGGRGDGPGEARGVAPFDPLKRLPGDTLLLDAYYRHILFGPRGEYLGETRIDIEGLRALGSWLECPERRLPDLTHLGCMPSPASRGGTRGRRETGSRVGGPRERGFLVRVSGDLRSIDTLGTYLGREPSPLPHPFFSSPWIAVGGGDGVGGAGKIHVALNPGYSIEVWSPEGVLERVIRRMDGRRVATAVERDMAWEQARGSFRGSDAEFNRIRNELTVPDSIPAVHGLTVGEMGDIWVRREPFLESQQTSRFDVFDRAGRFRGIVQLPGNVWLFEVGTDYLLGARLSEMMVPSIELYQVERGEWR